jgi:hypothetical protein
MYEYDEKTALVEKIEVDLDKANDFSVNAVDEFVYNGAIITHKIGQNIFDSLDKLVSTIKKPIYVKPKYHIVEEQRGDMTNYFMTEDYNYASLPIVFDINIVKSNIYTVSDISYKNEPYYLLTNLEGNTLTRFIRDFANKLEKGDIILYTNKF